MRLVRSLGTRSRQAPSPSSRGTNGEERAQLSRISLLHPQECHLFPWHPKCTGRVSTHSSLVPERDRGGEGPPAAFSVGCRTTRTPLLPPPRGVVQPSALVAVPEGPGGGGHPSSRRGCSTLSTSADPRVPLDPGESSSPIANSRVIAQVFRLELQRDAGDGDPRSTYLPGAVPPAASAVRERRCAARPARGRPEPGRRSAAANARRLHSGSQRGGGGAAAALPARLAAPRARAAPAPSAPAGCHWIPGLPSAGPASHGPARPPPRPTAAPGGNLKPRLRPLRQPPPAEGRRPARLGFPPPAPSAEAGGDWRGPAPPEEGEIAPWRRLPPRGSPGLALAPPEQGGGPPAPERLGLSSSKSHHTCDITWPKYDSKHQQTLSYFLRLFLWPRAWRAAILLAFMHASGSIIQFSRKP